MGAAARKMGCPVVPNPSWGKKGLKDERERSHRVPPGRAQPPGAGVVGERGTQGTQPRVLCSGGVNAAPEDSVLPGIWVLEFCIGCTRGKLCPLFHLWKSPKSSEKPMEEPWTPKQQSEPLGTWGGIVGSGVGAHVPEWFWWHCREEEEGEEGPQTTELPPPSKQFP